MILRVDPDSAMPVYEQLRMQVSHMVAAGTLTPGTQLPTIRQLAADLGLAKGTVSKAYDELLHSGVVVSDGRRGTRVADRPSEARRPDIDRALQQAAEQYAVTVHQLGVSEHDAKETVVAALRQVRRVR